MALVDSVNADSTLSEDRQNVSGSISANTGIAFAATIAVAEAVKENGEQTTSLPGSTLSAINAVIRAEVAELTEMENLHVWISDHNASNCLTLAPPKKRNGVS